MIDTLDHYIWRSLPQCGDFTTAPGLRHKVDESGHFLPFFGNTTVFLLDSQTKEQLRTLQTELYHSGGGVLAQPLDPDTFHVTLHDLANGPVENAHLRNRMAAAAGPAKALLAGFQNQPLRMQATWLFNMVNTSIVLGLRPADGESWNRLNGMYETLEQVVPLGYAMTPHITMAYFLPGTHRRELLEALSLHPVELELTLSNPVLQEFRDMNHYW